MGAAYAGTREADIPEVADVPLLAYEELGADLDAEDGNRITGFLAWFGWPGALWQSI
jgi:hypothetical protein